MSQWRVVCKKRFHDLKEVGRTVLVRADTVHQAEKIGREVTGLRSAVAYTYRPERDPAFRGYVVPAKN